MREFSIFYSSSNKMSRAAGQRLVSLLAQRHFRASGIVQKVSQEPKGCSMLSREVLFISSSVEHYIWQSERLFHIMQSKHPGPKPPPPPAYGPSNGQHPKAAKDPAMTPTPAGPGASSQAASSSTGGVLPTPGPPLSKPAPATAVPSKPSQAADTLPGSAGPPGKGVIFPGQKGQTKGAEPSGGPAQPQPPSPVQSSLKVDGAVPVSSTTAPSAASGHGPAVTVAPQPVKAAPEPSAAQPKAAPAQKPPPSAQGSTESPTAKAEAPGTSTPSPSTIAAGPPPAGSKAPQQYFKGAVPH